MEQQNRTEKGRVAGGIWKSYSFFTAIAVPPGDEVKDSDYDSRLAIAKRWVAAYPGSAIISIAGTRATFCLSGMANPVTYRLSPTRLPRIVRSLKVTKLCYNGS